MTFYRLTFYPNGQLDCARLDTDELEPELVASFRSLSDRGLIFDTTVGAGVGSVRVK